MQHLPSPTWSLALGLSVMVGVTSWGGCTPTPADDDDEGYVGDYDDDDGGGDDSADPYTGPVFTVGTFNIEWLRDYYHYRNSVDYDMVAQLINELDPTVMGLQEIDGSGAMDLLREHGLDSKYSWAVSSAGDTLRTVILYDSERISLSDRQDVDISPSGFRDLNVAELTLTETGESFVFGVVHLASEYDSANTEVRAEEVEDLHAYFSGKVREDYGDAADRFVIVGDFNDTFAGVDEDWDTLQPLEDDDDFVFASENTVTYTYISYRSKIDHIVLDTDLAARWVGRNDDENGCMVFAHDGTAPYSNYSDGYDDEQNISDHRPMMVELAVEDF